MPANLTQPCEKLPDVPKVNSVAELLRHDTVVVNQYGECAKGKDALIEALKQQTE